MALNIRAALDLRGMTATQLARRMGIADSSMSQIINGNPTLESLLAVARALRCDVAELFDRPAAWSG